MVDMILQILWRVRFLQPTKVSRMTKTYTLNDSKVSARPTLFLIPSAPFGQNLGLKDVFV